MPPTRRTPAPKGAPPSASPITPAPGDDDDDDDAHVKPYVVDSRGARALHFSLHEVQSRMRLDAPEALDLAYTRTMMGFLLFVPQPRHIGMVGLGGGSLVKFCHRHLAPARLSVAEINPHVLALRADFLVPADDERLSVQQADGARWLRRLAARTGADLPALDVLMLDGFDAEGMPEGLTTPRFFDDAAMALDDGGMMVVNLHLADPRLELIMDRLERAFGQAGEPGSAVLWVDDDDRSNRIVFAWRGRNFRRDRPGLVALPPSVPADEANALMTDFRPVAAAQRALRAAAPARSPRAAG